MSYFHIYITAEPHEIITDIEERKVDVTIEKYIATHNKNKILKIDTYNTDESMEQLIKEKNEEITKNAKKLGLIATSITRKDAERILKSILKNTTPINTKTDFQ